MNWKALFSFLLMGILLISIPVAWGQKTRTVGKRYSSDQLVTFDDVDHSIWDQLLNKYVDEDGMVDYSGWHESDQDRELLVTYINSLSRVNPALESKREAVLAFWINAYNAVTVEGILDVYPTSSIRNHTPKLAGYNIWKDLKLLVGPGAYSLNSIEHDILRKMDEPKIHFAIVCASIGCPRLLNQAYTADRLDDQLKTNSADFFSRQQNLQISSDGQTLKLSALIQWFGADFGKDTREQLRYLSPYFPENARTLISRGGFRVGYLDYDWNLNEQKN